MKRQDSLPTSSSHREIPKENKKNLHAKSIGCMSGIIHFVSGNHGRRKFLTFGKKQEKNEVSSPKNTNSSPEVTEEGKKEGKNSAATHFRRLSSSDVPRSPTLPAEIRRSNSVNSSENFRTPPALVARLMGLEEAPMSKSLSTAAIRSESAAEKRLKLLGALEKCDKDLKALKKVIDAVRSAERLRSSPITFISPQGEESRKRCSGGMWSESNNTEQPSPVSVLDELSSSRSTTSPLRNSSHFKPQLYYNHGGGLVQHHNQRQHQIIRKKPGEEEEFINPSIIFDRITSETAAQTWKNIKAAANVHEHDHDENGITRAAASPPWSNKAMRDSVEEVCRDIAWGERREIGRIGLGLQDHICRDLIEEIVIDMTPPPYHQHHHLNDHQHMSSYHHSHRLLPFEACKRRLCF